jgi:hypothetical protein
MFVKYDPEDGSDPQEWNFDPDDVLRSEATAVEKAYGASWEEWLNKLRVKEAKARTVLLWHLFKQAHPKLKFEDVPDFRMRQMTVEMSVKELRELFDQMSRTKMDENVREQFQAMFDRDIADAMQRETGIYEGEVETGNLPKAL